MIEEKHSAGLGNYKEGIVLSLWTLGLNFLLGSLKLAAGLWGRSPMRPILILIVPARWR